MISNSAEKKSNICPECRTSIPPESPGGLCPGCIIGLGLSSHADETRETRSEKASGQFQAPSAEELNSRFDQLDVLELVGQGGMGAVYRARQISLDREVAVKILPPMAGADPSFIERFQREARALARLTHPNIVMVFEFGQIDDLFYFVMEFVDGVNLREAIQAGGLSNREALRVIPQICEALQFAHDHGIVHRDIKPENVMLDAKGRVKITDFGLAKLLERNAGNFTLTSTNQVLGTLKYMAPEQIENPNAVDHRSDIYSLGVVFYELLTGELPLGRFDPPSSTVASNVPLDPVVMRTLEKQPENRFQQASDVKSAIEEINMDEDIPPQKEIRRGPSASRPRLPVINFSVAKVFHGFGTGKGVMRVDFENEELILDIQFKDFLGGMFKSDYKEVRIAFEHILAFQPDFRWYGCNRVDLQTDYFKELADLPGAENGRVTLVFEQKHRKSAQMLCDQLLDALQLEESSEEPGEDEIEITEHVLKRTHKQFEQPAAIIKLAGIVDIIGAVIFFFGSIRLLTESGQPLLNAPFATLGAVAWMCVGIYEIYLAHCAHTLSRWRPFFTGTVVLSLIFVHPGAILLIPAMIWVLFLGADDANRRSFVFREKQRENDPSLRNSLWSDSQTRFEHWTQFRLQILLLGLAGFMAMVTWGTATVQANQPGGQEIAALAVFTGFGMICLISSILLFYSPSEFWIRAAAKTAMIPLHLFFPITFFIGRRMLKKIDPDNQPSLTGNPYVAKSEEFSRPR